MRSWWKRDVATLGGRTGFVKQAIRSGVPILPVATVGGHDTVFVLNEGKWLADALDKVLGLKKTLRGSNLPIIAGFPFPIAVEVLPAHVPLPAKIRTELLDPIEVDTDPERADDEAYVQKIYDQVRGRDPGGHGPAGGQAEAADPRMTSVDGSRPGDRRGWTSTPTASSRPEALASSTRCRSSRPSEMLGRWRGSGLLTGSPLDGLLEAYGWYGKEFLDDETVHPLLFPDRSGRPGRSTVDAADQPAPRLRGVPAALAAAGGAHHVRPLLYTAEPKARLREVTHRGS